MDNKDEQLQRVLTEEDYIRAPKFSNSIAKFVARNSDGVDNSVIARILLLSEEEVEKIYQESLAILREEMSED